MARSALFQYISYIHARFHDSMLKDVTSAESTNLRSQKTQFFAYISGAVHATDFGQRTSLIDLKVLHMTAFSVSAYLLPFRRYA